MERERRRRRSKKKKKKKKKKKGGLFSVINKEPGGFWQVACVCYTYAYAEREIDREE